MKLKQIAFPLVLLMVLAIGACLSTPQQPGQIPQFVDPLPTLSVAGGTIETLIADTTEVELHMREFQANVMPSTFVPASGKYTGTWVWGYRIGPNPPAGVLDTYTGPVIVATRNQPAQFRFVNDLGSTSTSHVTAWVNSTDQTLHWADPLNNGMNMGNHQVQPGVPPMAPWNQNYDGPIPTCVHLHGGEVPPVLDGGPNAWYTSDGLHHGSGYYTKPGVAAAGNEAVYRYPNTQEAAPLWFHDHVLGITRLNVYAGLAGAYDVIDPNLALPTGLHPLGLQQGAGGPVEYLTPLVIQDRMFDANGQLFFPTAEADPLNPEHPYWLPEFTGDTILVNGKVWPYFAVQAKRYRFLIINGSNARTYELFLTDQKTGEMGPPIWQIATDGGYLDFPVPIDPTGQLSSQKKLLLMPGERADIIIDFAGQADKNLILSNTGITPYPSGDAPDPATNGKIIQFRVREGSVQDKSYDPSQRSIPLRPAMVRLADPQIGTLAWNVTPQKTRQLTLNEVEDDPTTLEGVTYPGGPEEILVNNTKWDGMRADGSVRPDFVPITINGVTDYVSELPKEGDTEVWEIVNLTMDAHPVHTHLVQFQLINRQPFDTDLYSAAYAAAFPGGQYVAAYGPPLDYNTGNPRALGGNPDVQPFLNDSWTPPQPNEAGWKDVIMAPPGYVTRIAVRFAPQDRPLNATDLQYSFDPNALGFGYVWHCHIIDHEDNEMMRPTSIVPKAGVVRTYVQGVDY